MKTYILILILLVSCNCLSQNLDTTLFSSEFEKTVFKNINDSIPTEAMDVLIAMNYDSVQSQNIRNKIKTIESRLDEKGISSKPRKKQIKEIYKYVHSSLLKKYVEETDFDLIFKTGQYNCVTASALYALVLDYFKIDYHIKETPQHVYIIADPSGNNVLIESTNPLKGVFIYDERFKKDFVSYLQENKIISEQEQKTHTVNDLFNQYYDKNKTINIYELGALQYYNKGVIAINDSKFRDAAVYLEKATLIYPSNTIKYMLNAALANVLNDQNLNKNYDGKTLAKFMNMNTKNSEAMNYSKDYFDVVSNELVINKSDIQGYIQFYDELSGLLSDSVDLDNYSQKYYQIRGYYEYTKGNYPAALEQLNLAYISNPGNIQTKQFIEEIGMKHMFTDQHHDQTIDSIEFYHDIFPFLLDKDQFQRYYTYCYLRTIQQYFAYNKTAKGHEYLKRFERVVEQNKGIIVNESYVENAYTAISGYYVRKHDYNKAISYLEDGLKLAPGSLGIEQRIKNLKELHTSINRMAEYQKPKTTPVYTYDFNEIFDSNFPGCWVAKYMKTKSEEKEIPMSNELSISASKDKTIKMTVDNKVEKGKWAVRYKSKLLYFIPYKNKEDYIVYKIKEISKDKLVLRPYEGNRISKYSLIFEKCKN